MSAPLAPAAFAALAGLLARRAPHDHAAPGSERFPASPMHLRALLAFSLADSRTDLARSAWLCLCCAFASLMTPVALARLADHFVPNAAQDQLLQMVLVLLASVFAWLAFEACAVLAAVRTDARALAALQSGLLDRLLHLPAAALAGLNTAALAHGALGLGALLRFVLARGRLLLAIACAGAVNLAVMGWFSPFLALLALLAGVVLLMPALLVNLLRQRLESRSNAIAAAAAGQVFQCIEGVAKIRSGGAEAHAFSAWAARFVQRKTLERRAAAQDRALAAADAFTLVLCSLLSFAAVAYWYPEARVGAFLAFHMAWLQFLGGVLAATRICGGLAQAAAQLQAGAPLLHTLPESGPQHAAPPVLSGAIELSRLRFRYQADGPLVLNDISLQVGAGEFIAIVGASGCGKSTLLRLLLGFVQPESGALYLDRHHLAGLDITAVRRQFGVVLQNARLLPGDLFSNIAGDSGLALAQAWDAARQAGIAADIEALPLGMATPVGQAGSVFSGGQRQRLLLARALARQPRILLLDEATSALDMRAQAEVMQHIGALDATRIVVAHRLSTIRRADRIVVLEQGRIVESGSYAELIRQGGSFAALAQGQLSDE